MIRIVLPAHLRRLACVEDDVELDVDAPITLARVLDALERRFPVLEGTIRDHSTRKRRPFLRFFACEEDLSYDPPDQLVLPDAVRDGREPLYIIGAIAGG